MSKCTSCNTEGAYISCFTIECPNPKCEYYCETLEKSIQKEKESKEKSKPNSVPFGFWHFPYIPMVTTHTSYWIDDSGILQKIVYKIKY